MRNLLVAQSGGPTSAINATIAGVIMEAHASDQVDTIYGAVNGIKGVLEERFVNLSEKVPGEDELEILCQTPAAALGSCRVKLKNPEEDDSQFQEIIRIFRKHGIAYFIYAGGNDSMDTVDKLAAYCKEHEIEDIHVMGAPKTIDNDLVGTDHSHGRLFPRHIHDPFLLFLPRTDRNISGILHNICYSFSVHTETGSCLLPVR